MNHPCPITEIHNHQISNHDAKRNISYSTTNTTHKSTQQHSQKIKKLQYELEQLRTALCDAIDQNELLRYRVAQLEALLVEAQDQNQKVQQRYLCDHNKLIGFWKSSSKDAMQLQKQNQPNNTQFYRSRSL